MRRRLAIIALGAWCLVGCAQESPNRPPEPVAEIDHILLMVPPVAMNLDSAPGLDGVVVKVFTFRLNEAHEQMVQGTMELMLYAHEGPADMETIGKLVTEPPLKQWSYGSTRLARRRFRDPAGLWGYRFTLDWGTNVPTTKRVLVIARYRSPSGKELYSKPTHVALTGN
jgi:hypothetical protein